MLAGSGLALAGIGGGVALETPVSIDESVGFDWPMARYDPAGTGHNPAASGPKDGVRVKWETTIEERIGGPAPSVALGDTLFVVSDSALIALDRETGQTRFERSGHSYLSGPTRAEASAYATDALVVRGIDGLHALSAGGGYALGDNSFGLIKTSMTVPTLSGNMATVDSKGRIVLPQEVRERLGITPGTEVDVREEDGKAVVEPEDSPDEILEQMEQLVEEASSNRGETTPLSEGDNPVAHKHKDAVQRGAKKHDE